MADQKPKKPGNKSGKKGSNNFTVLDDEVEIKAAVSTGPADLSDTDGDESSILPATTDNAALVDYLKGATASFEKMMEKAVRSMVDSIKKVERALEHEGARIDDLEKKNKELENRMAKMEKAYNELQQKIGYHDVEVNKTERFARKNNFRIVGIVEPKDGMAEDCVQVVEDIIKDKFKLNVKVERAHREGKQGDKARHIIVKTLSYREKIHIMKNAREELKGETYYFTDDLTKADLTEKKKHMKKVQELYQQGTKLRFYSGLWRGNGGVPYFTV